MPCFRFTRDLLVSWPYKVDILLQELQWLTESIFCAEWHQCTSVSSHFWVNKQSQAFTLLLCRMADATIKVYCSAFLSLSLARAGFFTSFARKKSRFSFTHLLKSLLCASLWSWISCRYDSKLNAYVPYAKSWIKEQLATHIRKQYQARR